MSGTVQRTYTQAVNMPVNATAAFVPFTGLPFGIAEAIMATANMAGVTLLTVDNQQIVFGSGILIGNVIELRCKGYISSTAFIGLA